MLRHTLKIGLLFALIVAELLYWADVTVGRGRIWSVADMPLKFWLMHFALLVAAYIRFTPLRVILAIACAASTLIVLGSGAVVGTPISFFDFVTMVDARSALPDMYDVHGAAILWAGLPALLVLFGVGLSPPATPKVLNTRWTQITIVLLPLVAFGLLTKNVHGTQGAVKSHAASWLGLSYAALYGYENMQGHAGERAAVSIPRAEALLSRDIVLIVDESVAGPYLDLTNSFGVRSGLLEPNRAWNTANFGIASSMTNCSMGTNAGLRFGAVREDYQRNIARAPSIWAYAQKAGLRTVYFYGQRGGRAENYISDAEKTEIDEEVYFDEVDVSVRDFRIADMLAERLTNGVPEFILINKYGVHFPLKDIVPEASQPAPDAEGARMIKGAIPMGDEASGDESWDEYKAAYRRAVSRSVGGFFDRLNDGIAKAKPQFTLFYTSDHGQQFHEREVPGLLVHCRKDAVMEEGAVSLVVLEGGNTDAKVTTFDWQSAANTNRDSKSHYQIFPSLLRVMGYQKTAISNAYGPDLVDADKDPQTFASEMYIHFGGKPLWHRVNPQCLIIPGAEGDVLTDPKCTGSDSSSR